MPSWQKVCAASVAVPLTLAIGVPVVAQESEPVSMEGTLIGAHWPDMTGPACDQPDTLWRFKIAVAGQLVGLGEVEAYTTHCTIYDPESGVPPSYYDRMTTFTTAEGDMLAVVHDFPATEVFVGDEGLTTGFTLDGTWEAVGGTGQFMHAAGTGTVSAAADVPGEIVVDFAGEITLDPPAPPAE